MLGKTWLRELAKAKEMEKDLERQEAIIGLFMKIIEIRRKRRWKVIGCMWGGKWKKLMETEENRGFINKNPIDD